jgi:tRNA G10  N-methylase Trm11
MPKTHINREILPLRDIVSRGETKAELLDNVQFIYELALAQLELEALGADFQVMNGLRDFVIRRGVGNDRLRKRVAYFKSIDGETTDYFKIIQHNITRSVNQYLTHWIYPYKGKFHPQMIRALLNIIKLEPGDTVLDPFLGSGTTAVEAQLLGIHCIGIDISPLCVLQSKTKTEMVHHLSEIKTHYDVIVNALSEAPIFGREANDLDEKINSLPDETVHDFYRMVKLVAISDNERRGRNFKISFKKNLDAMISSVSDYQKVMKDLDLTLGNTILRTGDARYLPLENESIDGIITSPPYSIALDYVSNDSHALKELDHDLSLIREAFIGVRGKGGNRIELYNEDMGRSITEMYRVLRPGRFAVVVVGNATYMGEEVKTVETTISTAERIGFKLAKSINKIIFGLYNVMSKENILIFRK